MLDLETINEVRFWEGKQSLFLRNGNLFTKEDINDREIFIAYHCDEYKDDWVVQSDPLDNYRRATDKTLFSNPFMAM